MARGWYVGACQGQGQSYTMLMMILIMKSYFKKNATAMFRLKTNYVWEPPPPPPPPPLRAGTASKHFATRNYTHPGSAPDYGDTGVGRLSRKGWHD